MSWDSSASHAVMYGGDSLHFDAIIPRIGASITFYGCAVVRQFEMQGVFPVNESRVIRST